MGPHGVLVAAEESPGPAQMTAVSVRTHPERDFEFIPVRWKKERESHSGHRSPDFPA